MPLNVASSNGLTAVTAALEAVAASRAAFIQRADVVFLSFSTLHGGPLKL